MTYIILAAILFAADQLTKYLTVWKLAKYESVSVIDGILSFTRYHNTGGPWSMFDGSPALFVIATFVIFAAEIIYLKNHRLKDRTAKLACALINAGAAGNLIDRIFRGYVVDMIEVKFIDYPVFNFADCCIVAGCILMCIYVIFIQKEPKVHGVKDEDNGKNNADM